MLKIGLSTCGFTPTEEAFGKLAAAGIDAVELSMEKGYMDALDFAAVKGYADACGVESVGIPARTSIISQRINHFMREVAGVWHYLILGGQYE